MKSLVLAVLISWTLLGLIIWFIYYRPLPRASARDAERAHACMEQVESRLNQIGRSDILNGLKFAPQVASGVEIEYGKSVNAEDLEIIRSIVTDLKLGLDYKVVPSRSN